MLIILKLRKIQNENITSKQPLLLLLHFSSPTSLMRPMQSNEMSMAKDSMPMTKTLYQCKMTNGI